MIKSGKVYTFKVEFFPKEAGNYELFIPMVIEKSMLVANPPKIICEALKPQFLFEPSTIDFKRKIVTKPDRSYPKFLTVTISNIDDD